MAGLEQLKKRLRSVELSGQMAGAMKTVASAKFSKIGKMWSSYRQYAEELKKISAVCGSDADEAEDLTRAGRNCYMVFGYNRGLCGGYNAELHAFAGKILRNDPGALLIVCGKAAIAYFEEKRMAMEHRVLLPDVPEFEDCRPLAELVQSVYAEGGVRSVQMIYQHYVNTLTQTPVMKQLLPLTGTGNPSEERELLVIPDRESALEMIRRRVVEGVVYSTVLEVAMGSQAATLIAMRTAYDNAAATAETLEHEINKKRQSAVTTGVIETSAGALFEGEEQDGERR